MEKNTYNSIFSINNNQKKIDNNQERKVRPKPKKSYHNLKNKSNLKKYPLKSKKEKSYYFERFGTDGKTKQDEDKALSSAYINIMKILSKQIVILEKENNKDDLNQALLTENNNNKNFCQMPSQLFPAENSQIRSLSSNKLYSCSIDQIDNQIKRKKKKHKTNIKSDCSLTIWKGNYNDKSANTPKNKRNISHDLMRSNTTISPKEDKKRQLMKIMKMKMMQNSLFQNEDYMDMNITNSRKRNSLESKTNIIDNLDNNNNSRNRHYSSKKYIQSNKYINSSKLKINKKTHTSDKKIINNIKDSGLTKSIPNYSLLDYLSDFEENQSYLKNKKKFAVFAKLLNKSYIDCINLSNHKDHSMDEKNKSLFSPKNKTLGVFSHSEILLNLFRLNKLKKKLKKTFIGLDAETSVKNSKKSLAKSTFNSGFSHSKNNNLSSDKKILSSNGASKDKDNNNNNNSSIKDLQSNRNLIQTDNNKNKSSKLLQTEDINRFIKKRGHIYDSLDDEEKEELEDIVNFILYPNSIFVYILDFLILFSTFIYLFYLPLYLCSSLIEKNYSNIFLIFVDIIYIIDLISQFFRAYYNFDEYLVINSKDIFCHYIKNGFLTDLICSIPFYSILLFNKIRWANLNLENNSKYLLLIIKIIKITNIFDSNSIVTNIGLFLQEIDSIEKWGKSLLFSIFSFAFLNFCSCIYIFIGKNCYPNWIVPINMKNSSFIHIYLASFYFVTETITTVGYGDVVINSGAERIFHIFLLIGGNIAYSWLVSSISSHIKKSNDKSANYLNKINILNEIKVSFPNLNDKLYGKIFRYLHYRYYNDKKDKKLIIESLPYSLKNTLIMEMYKPIINNFIFFKNFNNTDFITNVVLAFRPILAVKGDILVQEGEFIDDMIFVKTGVLGLEMNINLDNPMESVKSYLSKNFFKNNLGEKFCSSLSNCPSIDSSVSTNNAKKKKIYPK